MHKLRLTLTMHTQRTGARSRHLSFPKSNTKWNASQRTRAIRRLMPLWLITIQGCVITLIKRLHTANRWAQYCMKGQTDIAFDTCTPSRHRYELFKSTWQNSKLQSCVSVLNKLSTGVAHWDQVHQWNGGLVVLSLGNAGVRCWVAGVLVLRWGCDLLFCSSIVVFAITLFDKLWLVGEGLAAWQGSTIR